MFAEEESEGNTKYSRDLAADKDIADRKKEFRKKALAIRDGIGDAERARKDDRLFRKLSEVYRYKAAGTVGLYCSYRSEAGTRALIEQALSEGKQVYLPGCVTETPPTLALYRIESLEDLREGYKGILEPDPARCERLSKGQRLDVVVVPGVAFDKKLHRMGYGKGYYDRFLGARDTFSIGLAYKEQVYDEIPASEYDQRMDMIVTDENIIEKEVRGAEKKPLKAPEIPASEPERQYYYMELARGPFSELKEKLGRTPTYHVTTFGCQMNARDSEKLAGILQNIGFIPEDTEEAADFVIFNTCTVRDNADQRLYGRLGHLKGEKYRNPHRIIALCGCLMQEKNAVRRIRQSYPYVNIIFGTHNIYKLAELYCLQAQFGDMIVDVWEKSDEIVEDMPSVRKYPFKSGVNIMFGCNNFCSYCIVPYVRGRERSREPKEILREIERLAEDGVTEVMLLGQNVNSYGRGLKEPITFAELLKEVAKVEGIRRIRFMTSHPKDLSDELIAVMKESEKICRHIHLPLQSGSTRILKQMNRQYTKEQYLALAEKIRREIPDIAITTDIIIGFPGETGEDIEDTLDVIRQVEYDGAFTFIYSKRTGTPAAVMENQVPPEESRKHFDLVLSAVQESSKKRASLRTGTVEEVLVEEISDHDPAFVSGRLSSNLVVHLKGGPELIGSIVRVRLNECRGFYYIGERAD